MNYNFLKKYKHFLLTIVIALFGHNAQADVAEKPLVIVVPSYNNSEWYQKNLDSIFSQQYNNYRVIYIDDCSPDNTGNLVEEYIKKCNQQHRVTLIKNKTRAMAVANHYRAAHMCNDDEIILQLDGDDWFSDKTDLQFINAQYQNPNVWLTYGQFKNWPTNQLGYCKQLNPDVVKNKKMRDIGWCPGQLRTFYAWLFKQIQVKDLIFNRDIKGYKGKFFPANYDLAFYYPMMEMAEFNYKFIDKVIYIRNVKTPLNDFKVNAELQRNGSDLLMKAPKYPRLASSTDGAFDKFINAKASLIIESVNSPRDLAQLLDSINHYVTNISSIDVIIQNNSPEKLVKYTTIKNRYPAINFIDMSSNIYTNNKSALLDICSHTKNGHIIFATDTMRVEGPVNISECIMDLERTFAYSFNLALSKTSTTSYHSKNKQVNPPFMPLNDELSAWAYTYGEGDWKQHNNMMMSLYRTQDILQQIQNLPSDTSFDNFVQNWQKIPLKGIQVGLCHNISKVTF